MKKNVFYTTGLILFLLIVTNPSIKDFKDYLGVNSYSGLHRESNMFICSYFKNDNKAGKYLGVIGNVFYLKPSNNLSNVNENKVLNDSAKVVDFVQNKNDGINPFEDEKKSKDTGTIDKHNKNPFIKSLREFIKEKKIINKK